jgi:hypothetical protein
MEYPMASSLSSLVVKAVHNSYGVNKRTLAEQLTWNANRPYRGGACGVELDIAQHRTANRWCVSHDADYSSTKSAQLSRYLSGLDAWSAERNNDHPAVFIHFDLKNSPGDDAAFAVAFDDYVRAAMPRARFFEPGALRQGHATLFDAALNGWPTLEQVWGRFICVLSGQQQCRTDSYSADPSPRLCFADRDVMKDILEGPIDPRTAPNRIIYNFRYDRLAGLTQLIAPEYRDALLFRVYEVNDEDSWNLARAIGVNLIATDQVFVTKWALASSECPLCPITVNV